LESDGGGFTAVFLVLRRVAPFADKPSVFKGLAALEHPNRGTVKAYRFTPFLGKFVRCSLDATGYLSRVFVAPLPHLPQHLYADGVARGS